MRNFKLILEDQSIFTGYGFGALKSISGEVVFNTGMVGYPETLTDPSYKGQVLVLTYPLIGNYGVPENESGSLLLKNFESERIQVSGLVVDNYSMDYNHWSSVKSLNQWLTENDIPGIYGIDTRALTKKLREEGVMLGKLIYDKDLDFYDPNKENLVDQVSTKKILSYGSGNIKVVLVDCGVKNNIIRCLVKRNISVIRVPWNYDFNKLDYDGLIISNGPGDPIMCDHTIDNVKKALTKEKPIFGICLGNQILSLAAGAKTYKMKYGHRSQNQPCIDLETNKCYITTQNHGYAVDSKTLGKEWKEWFINANDNTNEGLKHLKKPFWSVQFHPEANPGPKDCEFLFDEFLKLIKK